MYDDLAIELAAAHHGVVSITALRRSGVDEGGLHALRRSRHWWSPSPIVLVRKGTPSTREQALTIAVFGSGPGAALASSTGGWLWGLEGCSTRPVNVVRLARGGRRPHGVRMRTVRSLPDDWVTELRGIPVVRPELCALQLFADCSYGRAERLVERLWSMRLLSGPSLRRFVGEMGAMGRNGTAGVRAYLKARPGDYVPSASNTESRVMQILRDAGIEVERQVDVGSHERWTGRVDFRVLGLPVIIEVQSSAHHEALTDRIADERRRAELEQAGWVWVEVWSNDLWSDPRAVVDAVSEGVSRVRTR